MFWIMLFLAMKKVKRHIMPIQAKAWLVTEDWATHTVKFYPGDDKIWVTMKVDPDK